MVTGFNHNIKHNGKVYHIQTEDSGVRAPHIITHLFVGGNIIATKKTSYNDLVGSANLTEVVKKMMEEQHKQMLRNLIHGAYDQAVSETGAPPPPKPRTTTQALPRVAPAPVVIPAPTAAEPAIVEAATEPNPFANDTAVTPPDFQVFPAASEPAAAAPTPAVSWAPVLRPAAAGTQPGAPVEKLPQPPTLPRGPTPPHPVAHSIWANTPSPARSPLAALAPPPEVMAARELSEKPVELPVPTDTIFGEDLLDEKSLDEVILSYLADDTVEG